MPSRVSRRWSYVQSTVGCWSRCRTSKMRNCTGADAISAAEGRRTCILDWIKPKSVRPALSKTQTSPSRTAGRDPSCAARACNSGWAAVTLLPLRLRSCTPAAAPAQYARALTPSHLISYDQPSSSAGSDPGVASIGDSPDGNTVTADPVVYRPGGLVPDQRPTTRSAPPRASRCRRRRSRVSRCRRPAAATVPTAQLTLGSNSKPRSPFGLAHPSWRWAWGLRLDRVTAGS